MTTKRQLEEILERDKKATPGPWQQNGSGIYGAYPQRHLIAQINHIGRGYQEECAANESLIKTARTDLPALARDYKEVMEALEAVITDPVAPVNTLSMQSAQQLIAAYHSTASAQDRMSK